MYDFRLYAASQPDTPIDSVKVRRDMDSAPTVLRNLADEVMRGNIDMTEQSRAERKNLTLRRNLTVLRTELLEN